MSGQPLVLMLVGTDHHPFDRLVRWGDQWAASHPEVRVLVQRGTSAPVRTAESVEFLEHSDLVAKVREAAVVVSHGGPSTISECRRSGRLPVVVPRDPAVGEHVDAHQMLFTERLAAEGMIRRATNEDGFKTLLDEAIGDPSSVRVESDPATDVAETCQRFGAAVAALFPGPVRR